MRYELPLQRRPSSAQDVDTLSSPRRPLSAFFFFEIDPLLPARHSSLHMYAQHIFPSKINRLDSSLEAPYAFAHQDAAFYWTRDDALANHKLNIWAKPPCLNCELAGENYARRCDRFERQENSLGQKQSCTRCQRTGELSSCIEQVEIRADGNYGHIEENEFAELDLWRKEELDLRKIGLVWWKPINLERGDIDRKRVVFEQSKQQDHAQVALPTQAIDSGKASWRKEQVEERLATERMALCQHMNRKLVAEWDEEDLNLEPRLLAQQVEEDATAAQKQLNSHDFTSTLDQEAVKLESDQLYWSNRIRAERTELCHEEMKIYGNDVASLSQMAWDTTEPDVVSQVCYFLERKQQQIRSGASEEEAIALSKHALSEEIIDHLEGLVPQIFRHGL